jgi:hypothetical protein
MYIITDPNLIAAAQRSRTLSFQALVIQIEKRFMGHTDEVVELLKNIPGGPAGEQDSPYTKDRNLSMNVPLQPGPDLNKMNAAVLKSVAGFVNGFGTDWEEENLWLWLRDTFTRSSSRGTFGAKFPLADDPELIQALW